VAAIVLLGFCIFVHELGHLLGGMMVGIKAKVFSMGYGKGIIKKKIGVYLKVVKEYKPL
jgi:regulator of sigma E protease